MIKREEKILTGSDRALSSLPQKYEDIDPRLQSEQMAEAYDIRRVLDALGIGGEQRESTP